ncbi:NADase-type glycan-binding domain-containing protein [Hyalangium minutum]|uniref:NAD glycohydrolase translocation F5/8 type C domain-containing protein n=1 Tax=Hyalangium minutum TaxID=394096 RepID=A0A085WR87_9BACT|nr:hypothetical protein [Hyalangium minutum]KFE70200.1 hypothetical protein DB31_5242 [Hyalangium minutum]
MRSLLLTLLLPGVAAAGEFHRLYAEEASASSFLKSNWNKYEENYHPSYVLDDDPKTAWVEGAEGDGIGESLTIPVSDLRSARAIRLVIFNGYQKSSNLLSANAAAKQLTVTVAGPGGQPSAKKQLTLERKMGPQSFDIPVTAGVAEVVLTLDSVHPGSKYRDTCISDVQVFVDSDVPYNPTVEKGKRERMLQWKKGRVATAKYFASLPKTYPYASTQFERKWENEFLSSRFSKVEDKDDDGEYETKVLSEEYVPLLKQVQQGKIQGPLSAEEQALLKELEALSRAGPPKTGKWYSVVKQKPTVQPEGLYFSRLLEPLLHPADMTLFEAQGQGSLTPEPVPGMEYASGSEEEVLSNLLLLEGSATDPKKVFFTYKQIVSERTTSTTTLQGVALISEGKLQRLVTFETSQHEIGEGTSEEVAVSVLVPTYTGGKVSKLVTTRLEDAEPVYDISEDTPGVELKVTTLVPPLSGS